MVIVIIAIFIAKNAFKMLERKENDDVKTDLLIIQAKVKVIKGKSEVNANTDNYVGTKVIDIENEEIKDFLKNIGISEKDFDKYFVLNYKDFEKMEITQDLKNMEDNVFIVNFDSTEVIYKKRY